MNEPCTIFYQCAIHFYLECYLYTGFLSFVLSYRYSDTLFLSTRLQLAGLLDLLRSQRDEAYHLFRGIRARTDTYLMEKIEFQYQGLEPGSNQLSIAQAIEQGWFYLIQAAECKYKYKLHMLLSYTGQLSNKVYTTTKHSS